MKKIYNITFTTKFYNIFFPNLLTEGVRATKYYLAGITNKYNLISLVLLDRIIGFITFFFIFLASSCFIESIHLNKSILFSSTLFALVFFIILLNLHRIKFIKKAVLIDKHLLNKELFFIFGISFIAQMAIMVKYFYIFHYIINLDFDFIKTVYISSASHLSQVIPFSTGLFNIKDAFLFFIVNAERVGYEKALSLILVLGSIETLIGVVGGFLESINLFKKTFILKRKNRKI